MRRSRVKQRFQPPRGAVRPVKHACAVKIPYFFAKKGIVRAAEHDAVARCGGKVVRKGQGFPIAEMALDRARKIGQRRNAEGTRGKPPDERMQTFALRRARRGEHENPTAYLRGGRNGRLHAHDGKGKFRAHLFRTDGGRRVAGEHRGIDPLCGKTGKTSADKARDLFRRTAPVGRMGVVPVIEKPRGGQTTHTRRKHGEAAHSAVKYPHPLPFPAGRRSHSVAKFLQNFSLPP